MNGLRIGCTPHFKPLKQNFHIAGTDLGKSRRSLYLELLVINLGIPVSLFQLLSATPQDATIY